MYVTGGDEYFTALYFRDDGTAVDISAQVDPAAGSPDRRRTVQRSHRGEEPPVLTLHP